jgi:hypothetical protein
MSTCRAAGQYRDSLRDPIKIYQDIIDGKL